MTMFSTIDVTVARPGPPTRDRFGNDVPGEPSEETVRGVLVAPGPTEFLDASRPEGVRVAYTLHFPKSFTGSLEGCTVLLPEPWHADGGYRVIGDPRPYMDANTPGPFNRPVEVEAAHG